jgi:hypothetical protein
MLGEFANRRHARHDAGFHVVSPAPVQATLGGSPAEGFGHAGDADCVDMPVQHQLRPPPFLAR